MNLNEGIAAAVSIFLLVIHKRLFCNRIKAERIFSYPWDAQNIIASYSLVYRLG